MVLESWETKIGVFVIHGDAKQLGTDLFYSFVKRHFTMFLGIFGQL